MNKNNLIYIYKHSHIPLSFMFLIRLLTVLRVIQINYFKIKVVVLGNPLNI